VPSRVPTNLFMPQDTSIVYATGPVKICIVYTKNIRVVRPRRASCMVNPDLNLGADLGNLNSGLSGCHIVAGLISS